MMVANIANEEDVLRLLSQVVEARGSNVFEKGMIVMVDEQGELALIERPDNNNGREIMLASFPKFIDAAQLSKELIREKRKVAKLSFTAVSGILPQSRDVFCLGAYGEGLVTDSSLTAPSFEGGQIFILGLRATNIDFAINKEKIRNVGIPTTILIVRTEKVLKARTTGPLLDNANESLEVKAMFAACVQGDGRIDEDTLMYHFPFSNASRSSYGRVCLGSVFGSELLLFERQIHLDRLPIEFYNSMASTHELAVKYASQNSVPYKPFLLSLIDKPFPSKEELIPMNMTYKDFINGAISSLYR